METKKKIGQRIRAIRKNAGLTQEALAEKVGVTGKFIGEIERGDNFASFPTFEAIASTLGCHIGHFFQIGYLDESDAELSAIIKKRLSKLSRDEKRKLLIIMDSHLF